MMPVRAVEIDYLAVWERQFNRRRLPAPTGAAIINHREPIVVTHIDNLICDLPWT